MATDNISVSAILPASPERIYAAWMNGKEHSAFSGGKATVVAKKGGKFTAWDGYITGTTLELEPFSRIVQSWRSSDFAKDAEDSRLEVILEKSGSGTRITLNHTNIPAGQGTEYRQGWIEYYFEPMKKYFAKSNDVKVAGRKYPGAARKKRAA